MPVITWLGCDLVTGRIVEELPELTTSGTISALLGAYTSASFVLPIPLGGHGAPPRNWESATEPGRSMIVALLAGVPIWAGIVLTRSGGTEVTVQLGCVSLEGYLARRYVRDHTWTQQDESSVIAAGLVGDANVEGAGMLVDAPPTGTLRDRRYLDQDDKSVYEALRELSGVIGGPEWTVTLGWSDATRTAVTRTLRVRSRIGYASPPPTPVRPTGSANAVFSSVGAADARYTHNEDYTDGRGANHVLAVSSGEGDTRPQSAPARDEALLAGGWPRWEHRFTPSTSITDVGTLNGHAARALQLLSPGSRTVRIAAVADAYPRLGTDWSVGDDVGFELVGHRHPAGFRGLGRAVGWELDPQAGTVSPILLDGGEAS